MTETAGVRIGYEVTVNDVPVASAEVPCDGGVHLDSALTGTGETARCAVRFTGSLGSVAKAYAALVPEPGGE